MKGDSQQTDFSIQPYSALAYRQLAQSPPTWTLPGRHPFVLVTSFSLSIAASMHHSHAHIIHVKQESARHLPPQKLHTPLLSSHPLYIHTTHLEGTSHAVMTRRFLSCSWRPSTPSWKLSK